MKISVKKITIELATSDNSENVVLFPHFTK